MLLWAGILSGYLLLSSNGANQCAVLLSVPSSPKPAVIFLEDRKTGQVDLNNGEITFELPSRLGGKSIYYLQDPSSVKKLVTWKNAYTVYRNKDTGKRIVLFTAWEHPERGSPHQTIFTAVVLAGLKPIMEIIDQGYIRPGQDGYILSNNFSPRSSMSKSIETAAAERERILISTFSELGVQVTLE